MRRRAVLALGSNLGDRLGHLQGAADGLAATLEVDLAAVSPVYETDPVGGPDQDSFLNAVLAVDADLDARELLGVAQGLEAAAGRVRDVRWGPRSLDVDVIWVAGDPRAEPDLEVPHPRAGDRPFVLAPLADIDHRLASALSRIDDWNAGVHRTSLTLTLPT